ncbi:MAG: N-formylglutamate amidohydrolase [Myxococcales bacterium]|nr:N-formylglutamate amidohydrolase [Myxococcales bacterium]
MDASTERIDAVEIGVDPGEIAPLLFSPATRWSPLVISFPHVGLGWPESFARPAPQVHFGRNADYEVHRLYRGADEAGAASLRAIYSRLLVDLNRADDDVSPNLVPDHPAPRPRPALPPLFGPGTRIPNRGVLWDTAVGNIPILSGPIAYAELELRLRRYYAPYYRALALLLERRRARFGYAILLEAHSMPSSVPGDLILGTLEGGSCSPEIEALALSALSRRGPAELAVRLNDPYRGGNLVRTFGRPEEGIHALQVEVNRALYMDEATLQVWAPSADAAQPAEPARSHARLLTRRQQRLSALRDRLSDLVRALASTTSLPDERQAALTAAAHSSSNPPVSASSVPSCGDSLVQRGAAGIKCR